MSEVSEIINSNFEKEEVNVEKKLKIRNNFRIILLKTR